MQYARLLRRPRVLIVDDERDVCRLISEFLSSEGFSVDIADNAVEALELLEKNTYDVALIDVILPGISGMRLISEMKTRSVPVTPILMSGYADVNSAISALQQGVFDYILKPFDLENLLLTVQRGVDYNRLLTETPYLEHPEVFYDYVLSTKPGISVDQILQKTVELVKLEMGTSHVCVFLRGDSGFNRHSHHFCDHRDKCSGTTYERIRQAMDERTFHVFSGVEVDGIFKLNEGEKPSYVVTHAFQGRRKIYGYIIMCGYSPPSKLREGKLKVFQIISALATSAIENTVVHQELLSAFQQTIEGLIRAIEAKDEYTKGHSERVAAYARALTEEAGYPQEFVEKVYQAALLHDIGKIGIKLDYLRKNGKLSEEEELLFRAHTEIGKEILLPIRFLYEHLPIVYYHHERWDGKGYPEGLKGEEIPVGARIVCIADAYDAMASDRPYRKSLRKEEIIRELEKNAGKQFDPELVKIFVQMIKSGKIPSASS